MVPKKKRGPAPTGKGIQVQVRLQPELLAPLDKAAADLSETSRPEAVRRILREWLQANGYLSK
ncbi:ribbon-helix-helix domain-containing protein [Mesorhizobium sp. ORS 3428]|uniref:ribbon-helix-helix domain-containing protein n=1 Tax=Mesorhizobium sp. ORS 3428 TaxID=540997 RepID=UPI00191C5C04|nr:ribbon-helix-helix domain-containing protein [Mesorhizobium sp. ORS 3428]